MEDRICITLVNILELCCLMGAVNWSDLVNATLCVGSVDTVGKAPTNTVDMQAV